MNSKKKQSKASHEVSLIRSSAAEYLTFVAASGKGNVQAVYDNENVWLTQKMMALLYDIDVRTINYHLKKVFSDRELDENSVIQYFRITAADGKTYDTQHYNLSAIIAVGYKVNSERAVQFRKWATGIIESFTVKGFAMDDERLKNDGSILTKKYFEEQLQRIREIPYRPGSPIRQRLRCRDEEIGIRHHRQENQGRCMKQASKLCFPESRLADHFVDINKMVESHPVNPVEFDGIRNLSKPVRKT